MNAWDDTENPIPCKHFEEERGPVSGDQLLWCHHPDRVWNNTVDPDDPYNGIHRFTILDCENLGCWGCDLYQPKEETQP